MLRERSLLAGTAIAAIAAGLVLTSSLPATGAGNTPKCFGKAATIVKGDGANEVDGTDGNDVIVTKGGGDNVEGLDGNDRICTGPGADGATGGLGNDMLSGGGTADSLDGDTGLDLPGDGKDVLKGGVGADRLEGNGNDDDIFGDAGNDLMDGQGGTDFCDGGRHADSASNCEEGPDANG